MKIVNQSYKMYLGANPYKGFVPFIGDYALSHSMEFIYFPLNEIQISEKRFSWGKFEKTLNSVRERNHTAIVRIYLDYPDKPSGFPEFYFREAKQINYDEFGGGIEVDWNDTKVIQFLKNFIKIFGKKYNGDKRIAFLECGLLGHWGEWHTWPNKELMASYKNQIRILKTYRRYFNKTKCLVRYPNNRYFKKLKIGFHDDSFCFSTLPSKKGNFLSLMQESKLLHQYKSCVIGGEVRPEEQFSLNTTGESRENFAECVSQTHCSWLLNQGAFEKSANEKVVTRHSAMLGYDFYVSEISLSKNNKRIKFQIKNNGHAPIYHDFFGYIIFYKDGLPKICKKIFNLSKMKLEKSYKFSFKLINCQKIVLQIKDQLGQKVIFSNIRLDEFKDVIIAEEL